MTAQYWCMEQLSKFAPVAKMYGWQKDWLGTSQIRKYLGLHKDKKKNKNPIPETHAVQGVALAASKCVRFTPYYR